MDITQTMEGDLTKETTSHKYDRRGRTYAVGYHVNSQGTDYNKSVLELSRKEIING